jgi:uncharacterized protein with HEPN domain
MKRDISVYIEDVLESIERIEDYTGSISRVWKAIREDIPDLKQKLIIVKKDL